MIGCLVPLLHPLHDVAAGGDFPIMNMRRMAEPFEFVPDPKRPIAITARIADENIGHAPVLAVVRQGPQRPLVILVGNSDLDLVPPLMVET